MKLTTKSRYGVRAFIEIARAYGKKPVTRTQICTHMCSNHHIPKAYLENILTSLKQGGFIEAVRGSEGGFRLKLDPAKITFYDLVKVLQGGVSPSECLDDNEKCNLPNGCPSRIVWKTLYDAQVNVLKGFTVEDILKRDGYKKD